MDWILFISAVICSFYQNEIQIMSVVWSMFLHVAVNVFHMLKTEAMSARTSH